MRLRAAIVLTLLIVPCVGWAAGELERLSQLIEEGRMEQAYELASKHVDARAGKPEFDLYYGIAAVETGRLDEGIFALERVLINRPGLDRARIELARAFYLQEQDRKARKHFEIVLSHDPPPSVESQIERFLVAIEQRSDRYNTQFSGYIETELGTDSNVGQASEETTEVELAPGFPIVVGSQGPSESDSYLNLGAGINLSQPVFPGFNIVGGLRLRGRSYNEQVDSDRRLTTGQLGFRYRAGSHRLAAYFRGRQFVLGDEPFRTAHGVSLSYRYQLSQRTSMSATGDVTQLRYDELESRDATRSEVGFGVSRSWLTPRSPSAGLTVLVGQETPEEDTQLARSRAERDVAELRARLGFDPAQAWRFRMNTRVQASEYATEGPFIPPEARQEQTYTLDVSLDWRPSVNWSVGPHIQYSERSSNVAIFEYTRTTLGIRARYSFY